MEQTDIKETQETQESSEVFLTASQICEKLQIADSTLRNYLKNEKFPRLKLGGEYRFLYSEVLAYMRQQAEKAVNNDKT